MKKQMLLLLLFSASFGSLFGKYKLGAGGIKFVQNTLKTTRVIITRTEDGKYWTINPNSKQKITAWVPWCRYGKIEIKLGEKVRFSFGERSPGFLEQGRWTKYCGLWFLFNEGVKGRIYNLKITGTDELPQLEFYSSDWKHKKAVFKIKPAH